MQIRHRRGFLKYNAFVLKHINAIEIIIHLIAVVITLFSLYNIWKLCLGKETHLKILEKMGEGLKVDLSFYQTSPMEHFRPFYKANLKSSTENFPSKCFSWYVIVKNGGLQNQMMGSLKIFEL